LIDDRRIAVVVPARDEARHIAEVVRTMPRFVDHIAIIDDGSRDDTATIARAAAGAIALDVLRHDESRGVGAAIVSGYRHAVARGADVVAVMAGDAQMDPADLRSVVIPVIRGEADYVKGNRLRHPDALRAMPLMRLGGTFVLGQLTALATGTRLGDSQCGYTALAANAIRALDHSGALAELYPRYGYPNDLLGLLAASGQRIAEVTVRPVYRDETSGLRAWHVPTMAWLIARAGWRRVLAD
jgi:glycosyltransferase involved in cell wall biosynthesis